MPRFRHATSLLATAIVLASCGGSGSDTSLDASAGSPTTQADGGGSATTSPVAVTASTTEVETGPRRVLRAGVLGRDNPPLIQVDGEDVQGFEPDVLEAIAAELGGSVSLEWVFVDRQNAYGALGDTHDIHADGINLTEGRADAVIMTNPHVLGGWTAFVPETSPISSFAELETVALPAGTTIEIIMSRLLQPLNPDTKLVGVENSVAAVEDGLAQSFAAQSTLRVDGYRPLPTPAFDLPISMAVADEGLRDEINQALSRVVASGEWQRIYEDWFGGPAPFDPTTMSSVPPIPSQ